jgi:hypothetical protein
VCLRGGAKVGHTSALCLRDIYGELSSYEAVEQSIVPEVEGRYAYGMTIYPLKHDVCAYSRQDLQSAPPITADVAIILCGVVLKWYIAVLPRD